VSRAEYNRTVEVYWGPGTGTPGVFRREIFGRVVPCTKSQVTNPIEYTYTHYINYNAAALTAVETTPVAGGWIADSDQADTVDVPSLGLTGGIVQWNELITPGGGRLPYRRSYIFFFS